MDKNKFALTPPMGWNSYDYYDTRATEADIKANADYMATYLKSYGWEYIVVDIQWYAHDAGSQRGRYQYIPFGEVEMDEYSRLLPCPDRFSSAVDGNGFKPLADYVHNLGLKFGIHIMRGIPRAAAHKHTNLLGTSSTANEIADPASICWWNPDMYGVLPSAEGSQAYYDSIFALYAQWGVDFVKCDDICRMDMPSAKKEIEMLHKAIMKCGHPIVLSLSPGPAKIEEAWHYETYANMWRITDDLWDQWPLLLNMFDRCELWQKHVSEGCYPDCDMLPLGYLGKGFGHEWQCKLTPDEQITMMTLWCIFRSPLMLGCELTKLDDQTLTLITNREVLRLICYSYNTRQLQKNKEQAIWYSEDNEDSSFYLAFFNFKEEADTITVDQTSYLLPSFDLIECKELWSNEPVINISNSISVEVAPHGAKLIKCVR